MCLARAVSGDSMDGMVDLPGPSAEPADILSREYLTGDWFGLRDKLNKHGLDIEPQLFVDYSRNTQGGLRSGDAFRNLFNLSLVAETGPLLGYEGGTLFLGFQTQNGRNGTESLTGDIQGFDNIDAQGFTQLSELWYEQKLAGDKLRFKLGKFDANTEFAYVEYGGEFLHSSPGFSPTIAGFPGYPDPATAFLVAIEPVKAWYASAAVFDGATQDGGYGRTGNRGPATLFGAPADLFLIGETGFKWTLGEQLPGRFGIGLWHHTGSFDRFDGGTEAGTTGFYAVCDQFVWRENPNKEGDEQGIGLFLQYGWANRDISAVSQHVGVGAAWSGAIPTRDEDIVGIMASYAALSDEPGAGFADSFELSVELFYKVQLTPWLSLKPDVQYIVNPGGGGNDDALVFTLRCELGF